MHMKSFSNKVMVLHGLGITLVMCSLSIGLNIRANRMREPLALAPHGCYTAQQILCQADRLNALLSPAGEPYIYTAEYTQTCRPGSTEGGYWSIACTNLSGTRERCFLWNAYSGQLEAISCIDHGDPHSGNVLSCRAAVECAMGWVQYLGLVKTHERRQLMEPPHKLPNGWTVAIKAGQTRLLVQINGRNGRPFNAHVSGIKPGGPPPP
jgi:hypothetical protein